MAAIIVAVDVSPRTLSPMNVSADSRRRLRRVQPEACGQDPATNAQCRVRVERRIHPAGVQSARVVAG